MNINLMIYLMFIHWVADFICQTNDMAELKSKFNKMLFFHCCVYTGVFMLATQNVMYAIFLGAIHFPIDYITSRINSKLYVKGNIHNFFISIGFDQFIHITTIILLGEKML